jgi:hypothetical protein
VWLFTTDGFYSAVAHRDDPNTLIVRSRACDDALRLVKAVSTGEVIETPARDYRFRVHLPHDICASYVAAAAAAIDYDTFKNAVGVRQGGERARVYADVWADLLPLQSGDA